MALSAAGSNSYQFGITKLWLMHQMSLRIGLPWWPSAKNLPAMQVMQVRSLGQEDPLEEELVTHSSILPWKIPCTEESGGLQSMGSQRVRYDWIQTYTYIFKNKLPQGVCVLPSYCCYCCSVAKSCPTLCDTMGSATSFPFAFNLGQHQGLFQWVSSSHQVTKILELQV